MGWIGCIRCEKFRHDFVAWSFALIAPAQPILHQVSCSNEMVPNAPKHYETQQKLSLGSNGVDQVRSLRKHPIQLRGMNFCINWTSSAHLPWVYCRNKTIPNAPNHYETQQKLSLGSNGVDQVRSLGKLPTQLRGTNFCISCTSSDHFALSLLCGIEFRFQWCGLGAFVVKTSDATLWHELLH